MSDEEQKFGAIDLGGNKFSSPSQAIEPNAGLINESIRRKQFSRWFAVAALTLLSISAVCCLIFSMWVGKHFLDALDVKQKKEDQSEFIQNLNATALTTDPVAQNIFKLSNYQNKPESKATSPEATKETFYIKILAPLIPASFSSAIAIILFITIARLVTNFEKMGKRELRKRANGGIRNYSRLCSRIRKAHKKLSRKRIKLSRLIGGFFISTR